MNRLIHLEALTQNVVGLLIAFVILRLFGLSTEQSLLIQSVFFVTSYIRSYAIRYLFSKYTNN